MHLVFSTIKKDPTGPNTTQKSKIRAINFFWCKRYGAQIRHFLACLYCQEQLKMKILIKVA